MDNYWRDREEQAKAEYALTEEQYVERLNGIYDYMLDQVKKEINGFYSKYMRAENITYAEATQRVADLDIEEYERKAAKYVKEKDFSKKANEEMRLYNLTMKVNRLELLKANIGLEMVSSFDELNDLFEEGLTEEALSEFRRQAGILGKTVQDNAKAASTIANASFHNATFSDRIWMYQGMLRNELDTLLRQGLIQGRSSVELARYLDRSFDAGLYNAERLMRTEMSRVLAEAQAESFIANGFDEYEFMALGTACEVCKAIDGQHFKVADRMPGENCPPMHPNCKCTITSWDDDELYQEWLNSYKDHGMDYDTWLANRPTAASGLQDERYKEWLDNFLGGDTDMSYDEWVKAKESGGETVAAEKEPGGIDTTKNFKQLEQYLKDTYGYTMDDSVKDLQFGMVKEALTGVEDMLKQYPSLRYSIKKISTQDAGIMSCDGGTVYFNPQKFTKSHMADSLQRNSGNWWPENSSLASIGHHEAAHAVEQLLIERRGYGILDEGQAAEDWINHTISSGIVDSALDTVRGTEYGSGKSNADLMSAVSGYAATQKAECFAEAFADVYANGDDANPLSIEITRLAQEQYDRGEE